MRPAHASQLTYAIYVSLNFNTNLDLEKKLLYLRRHLFARLYTVIPWPSFYISTSFETDLASDRSAFSYLVPNQNETYSPVCCSFFFFSF